MFMYKYYAGVQPITPTFCSPGFGQTGFGGQQGSRLGPYSATQDVDIRGKLSSISAIPACNTRRFRANSAFGASSSSIFNGTTSAFSSPSTFGSTAGWYAKWFLHPDIVAAYDYIFIWDEDLGVQHFNAEKYIQLVRKHGLEMSQPALEPDKGLTWEMTKRKGDSEVHKVASEKPGWCADPHLPPCAAFVEIMAPVFSRNAWRCVWHVIQNDLVHGWGLDFALQRCVEPAHEKIGIVDSQWIVHQIVPSLGN